MGSNKKRKSDNHDYLDHHMDAQIKCKELYNELRYNYDHFIKYQGRLDKLPAIAFFSFFLFIFILGFLNYFFSLNTFFSFLSILLFFITFFILFFKNSRLRNEFRLSDKELLILHLNSIANHISDFIKSNVPTQDIEHAKSLNKNLFKNLTPFFSNMPRLHIDRGLEFDKKFLEFVDLLKELSKSNFQNTLDGKRDNDALRRVAETYRDLAFYVYKEDFKNGIQFIKSTFKISITKENKFSKKVFKWVSNEIFKWVLTFIFLIILIAIIYFTSKRYNFINHESVPIWAIYAVVFASLPAIRQLKKLVDFLMDLTQKLFQKK